MHITRVDTIQRCVVLCRRFEPKSVNYRQKGELIVHKRKSYCPLNEKRLFVAPEGAEYTGFGLSFFRKWAAQIGAEKRYGRMVRYDRLIIDAAIDKANAEVKEAE